MGISILHVLQAASRFNERKDILQKRKKALLQAEESIAGNSGKAVELLNKIDSKERIAKRFHRLQKELHKHPLPVESEALQSKSFSPVQSSFVKRIIGKNDLLQAQFLDKGSIASRSVGRVVIQSGNNHISGFGTGFMISPRLFMTNNHVLPNRSDALHSYVEMNYQLDFNEELLPTVTFSFDADSFYVTNEELDVTIVAINENTNEIGWNLLIGEEGKVLIGEYLNIIQHPDGRPKEVSFRANRLIDVLPQFLHYETDTEPGSSGAPVYNDQWEVVALHHAGVPQRNADGKIIARNGNVWTPSMGETEVQWIANEGVRISTIIDWLKSMELNADEQQLRNGIFEKHAFNIAPSLQTTQTKDIIEISIDNAFETGSSHVDVQIPLQVRINFQPFNSVSTNLKDDDVLTNNAANHLTDAGFQQELNAALKEVKAARQKKYYNKKEDDKHKKLYYNSIEKTEKDGDLFYKNLSDLLLQTHTSTLRYQPSKHVYTWVDWQPNKKLRSIYSWKEYKPEELIEKDLQNESRLKRFTETLLQESSMDETNLVEKIETFEASLPYNCEHVVPQSWFGKKEPMRGDLHHLFTCEWGCNSFRNKIPYYDFPDFEEAVRSECGKREKNKFEPGNGKGAIARATLYFLLRYPGQINNNANEYTATGIEMLLNWHFAHKVSQHERHRNAAIFALQGNRNPLIDYPQWAKKINFVKGLGKRK